ncbi:hypothetical protein EBR77_04190 [bacterium]|nr:hypothetical protein [bacterium]
MSPFHGFSPSGRSRAASNGSEQTVLAGLVRGSTFGSTGSLHEHPFSPCKKDGRRNFCNTSIDSFGSLSEHPVTPTK